jgi:hypothetical protein
LIDRILAVGHIDHVGPIQQMPLQLGHRIGRGSIAANGRAASVFRGRYNRGVGGWGIDRQTALVIADPGLAIGIRDPSKPARAIGVIETIVAHFQFDPRVHMHCLPRLYRLSSK